MPDHVPAIAADPLRSVHHDGSALYVGSAVGGVRDRWEIGDEVVVGVRAAAGAPIDRVLIRMTPDGEQTFVEMERQPARDAAAQWWTGRVRLTERVTGYRFAVLSAGRVRWLNGNGLHESVPLDTGDFRILAGYEPPSWVQDSVIYQIFPDRFAASGGADARARVEAHVARVRALGLPASTRAWGELPRQGREALFEFYGGDLAGIQSRLDYVERLGANVIYLNPIFESLSNHGYDCIDYDRVAGRLGGDAALESLRAEAARRGMRLILDLAPNHVGAGHPWFAAAQADAAAPTAEYFSFTSHPDEYESWLGRKSLAKLDYRSERLRTAMYAGPDAVVRRWLRPPYAIDGWRIDVANMLGRLGESQLNADIARGLRAAVREENPEAYLVGENWFDASSQLQGDEWDATMDYAGFTTPLLEWLVGVRLHSPLPMSPVDAAPISTAAFIETLRRFRAAIPWQIARQQMLLLGSHDTGRIRTVLGGDRDRLRLAFALLFTYPGVPSVFYGDEIGLEGAGSLEARRTMPWDEDVLNHELLEGVRSLAHWRRALPALVRGGFQMVDHGVDWFAFARETDEDVAIVVARRAAAGESPDVDVSAACLPDGLECRDLVGGGRTTVAGGRLGQGAAGSSAIWYARKTES